MLNTMQTQSIWPKGYSMYVFSGVLKSYTKLKCTSRDQELLPGPVTVLLRRKHSADLPVLFVFPCGQLSRLRNNSV